MKTSDPTNAPPAGDPEPVRHMYKIIILLVLLVGLLGGFIVGREMRSPAAVQTTASKAADVNLPPELVRLATGWKCNCGNCKDLLLDCVCVHPRGALEVKRFMLDLQAAGTPLETIRQKVNERYGTVVTARDRP